MLTLFTDPFAQQLIRYHSCSISSPSSGSSLASIPLATYYVNGGGGGQSLHSGAGELDLPYQLQGVISQGVAGVTAVSPTCPTGNCTFPDEYFSLGYCSECADISSELNITQSSTQGLRETWSELPDGLISETGQSTFAMKTTGATTGATDSAFVEMILAMRQDECTSE